MTQIVIAYYVLCELLKSHNIDLRVPFKDSFLPNANNLSRDQRPLAFLGALEDDYSGSWLALKSPLFILELRVAFVTGASRFYLTLNSYLNLQDDTDRP